MLCLFLPTHPNFFSSDTRSFTGLASARQQMTKKNFSSWLMAILLLAGALAHGQSLVPSGCAQQTGPVLPWQDCQGAIWITAPETIIPVTNVRGPGCVSGELPASSQTCLTTNERRTVWLMFEVQALPGGPSFLGAPAGQLRFKIVPADVDGSMAQDDGQQLLGMTDFDFALFEVSSKTDRASACDAIRNATAVGTTGTVQAACNYSGLPGPTGLGLPGTGLSVDDQRYNRPIDVRVGQVFLLAVDNYSLNASYFRLVFGEDDSLATIPAAHVTPQATQPVSGAVVHNNKACGYGLEVIFPEPIALDSLRTDAFLLTYRGRTLRPRAISAEDPDGLRSQGTRFTLLFAQKLDTGEIVLEQTARLADRYGREQLTFTRVQNLRPPVRMMPSSLRFCTGQPFDAKTTSEPGFNYGGWTASPGFGPGIGVLGAFSLLNGSRPAPGTHTLTYHFFWPEGCEDSVEVRIEVLPIPEAPTLFPTLTGSLEAQVQSGATQEWVRSDSVFQAPAVFQPSMPGVYRVRQILNGCTSPWSNAVAMGVTQVRRAGDVVTSLYPNPAQGELNVRVRGAEGSPLHVEMMNSEGKTVVDRRFADADWDHQISLEGLKPGVYTVLLTTGTSATTHRLLLQ